MIIIIISYLFVIILFFFLICIGHVRPLFVPQFINFLYFNNNNNFY